MANAALQIRRRLSCLPRTRKSAARSRVFVYPRAAHQRPCAPAAQLPPRAARCWPCAGPGGAVWPCGTGLSRELNASNFHSPGAFPLSFSYRFMFGSWKQSASKQPCAATSERGQYYLDWNMQMRCLGQPIGQPSQIPASLGHAQRLLHSGPQLQLPQNHCNQSTTKEEPAATVEFSDNLNKGDLASRQQILQVARQTHGCIDF